MIVLVHTEDSGYGDSSLSVIQIPATREEQTVSAKWGVSKWGKSVGTSIASSRKVHLIESSLTESLNSVLFSL